MSTIAACSLEDTTITLGLILPSIILITPTIIGLEPGTTQGQSLYLLNNPSFLDPNTTTHTSTEGRGMPPMWPWSVANTIRIGTTISIDTISRVIIIAGLDDLFITPIGFNDKKIL